MEKVFPTHMHLPILKTTNLEQKSIVLKFFRLRKDKKCIRLFTMKQLLAIVEVKLLLLEVGITH